MSKIDDLKLKKKYCKKSRLSDIPVFLSLIKNHQK